MNVRIPMMATGLLKSKMLAHRGSGKRKFAAGARIWRLCLPGVAGLAIAAAALGPGPAPTSAINPGISLKDSHGATSSVFAGDWVSDDAGPSTPKTAHRHSPETGLPSGVVIRDATDGGATVTLDSDHRYVRDADAGSGGSYAADLPSFGRNTTVNDPIPEGVETVSGETSLPTLAGQGDDGSGQARLTLQNQDPDILVSFAKSQYAVKEGKAVTVAANLSADPGELVTITLDVSHLGGAGSDDYRGVPNDLKFGATQRSATFTFIANQDTNIEDGEKVQISFGSLSPGFVFGANAQTTVDILDDDYSKVSIKFAADSYTVAEGDSVAVTAVLDQEPRRPVVVPLEYWYDDGLATEDFWGLPSNLMFAAHETSKYFNFHAVQDEDDDDGESLRVWFGELPPKVESGEVSQTKIHIEDDDLLQLTVQFESGSYSVDEGASQTIKVVLDVSPNREIVIPIVHTPQSGATPGDYSVHPTSLTFGVGETSKPITFQATDDNEDDDFENVELSIGQLPDGVARGTVDRAVVTIIDNNDPEVTVRFLKETYTVNEDDRIDIPLSLDADPERVVVIPIDFTDLNGATEDDYAVFYELYGGQRREGVTFGPGQTTKSFRFTAYRRNRTDDDGESVRMTLGQMPPGVIAGQPNQATVNIIDLDRPTVKVSFDQATYQVNEGQSVDVPVNLDRAPERELTIPLELRSHTRDARDDYTYSPQTLVFDDTDVSKTFRFTASDDDIDDGNQEVTLGFGYFNEVLVDEGDNATVTFEIIDDDNARITATLTGVQYPVEGTLQTVRISLFSETEITREVTIPIVVTHVGGATADDYDTTDIPSNVTFPVGIIDQSFQFSVIDDGTLESSAEGIELRMGQQSDARVHYGQNLLTVYFRDTLAQSAPDRYLGVREFVLSFTASTESVDEGQTKTIWVQISPLATVPATIPLLVSTTGAATSDYQVVPTSLDINVGELRKPIQFTAVDDIVDDNDETVTISFDTNNLPDRFRVAQPSQIVVTIVDNEVGDATLEFEQSSYTIAEGDTQQVSVRRTGELQRKVRVGVQATVTSGEERDYSVDQWLRFAYGQDTAIFSFRAIDENWEDTDNNVVVLTLTDLPSGVSLGTNAQTTVNITNNDEVATSTVQFAQSSYSAREGQHRPITVTLSAPPGVNEGTQIPVIATPQGGAVTEDYELASTTVTFYHNETSKSFYLRALDDESFEPGESVKLTFGTTHQNISEGSPSETVVTLVDQGVYAGFLDQTYDVDEGGTVTVTVRLSRATSYAFDLAVTATPSGAGSGDYSVPATVSFAAGDADATLEFQARQDTVDDDGESVRLTFASPMPHGLRARDHASATVLINDDDHPDVTIQFDQSTYNLDEGASATIGVTLSAAPERTVHIDIVAAAGSTAGGSGGDYSISPSTLTFLANETRKSFRLDIVNDLDDDDNETAILTFESTLPEGFTAGTRNRVTVNIGDDDDATDSSKSLGSAYSWWVTPLGTEGAESNRNSLEADSCAITENFEVIWDGFDDTSVAEEFGALITKDDVVGGVTYSFVDTDGAAKLARLEGSAEFTGAGRFSIRVRAKFNGTWGSWSSRAYLYCTER